VSVLILVDTFIAESDTAVHHLARNAGVLRSLRNIFPNAELETVSRIASIVWNKRPPTGTYTTTKIADRQARGGTRLSIAARILGKEMNHAYSDKTLQNYLNLLCNMRIAISVNEYILHSYGKPLVLKLLEPGSQSYSANTTVSRFYYLDRLLYEDGDNVRVILSLCERGLSKMPSKNIGLLMRKTALETAIKRLRQLSVPKPIADYVRHRADDVLSDRGKPRTFRRPELEYTVRREWLRALGRSDLCSSALLDYS